ncbi:hypothetical protein Q31b_41930 [Novipirellula aureliae]|uniref:Uncharacterized protein n=1 Tax=Novipirellula aureliae TaxID=2527966 RepID=A0A5C6DQK2_9BACT|nr:hypothetical protein [Novipirellula aureliae]TWU39110.1 hypothetical protein Q31b_41930 [Novipirellula aureliae]
MSTRIFYPAGQLPYTDRQQYDDVETHIKANDALAGESSLLQAFHDADGIPASLLDEWTLCGASGDDDSVPWVEYRPIDDDFNPFEATAAEVRSKPTKW